MKNAESTAILASSTPRKRLFETGEMKLLVLHFIAESPKFSYDIIKSVATLVGGNYKPSTGTICPNINALEDEAYTQVRMTEDDRKQYHITEKGQRYLLEQQQRIQQILDRFDTRKQIQNDAQYHVIKSSMDTLKAALRFKLQYEALNADQINQVAQQIHQAAAEIKKI